MTEVAALQLHTIEHSVEDAIRKHIQDDLHGYVIKNQASATTGKGKPDLSACINGHYYAIEVKRKGRNVKTTLPQIKNLIAVAKAGGYAYYSKTPAMFGNDTARDEKHRYSFKDIDLLATVTSLLRTKYVVLIRFYADHLTVYQRRPESSNWKA